MEKSERNENSPGKIFRLAMKSLHALCLFLCSPLFEPKWEPLEVPSVREQNLIIRPPPQAAVPPGTRVSRRVTGGIRPTVGPWASSLHVDIYIYMYMTPLRLDFYMQIRVYCKCLL